MQSKGERGIAIIHVNRRAPFVVQVAGVVCHQIGKTVVVEISRGESTIPGCLKLAHVGKTSRAIVEMNIDGIPVSMIYCQVEIVITVKIRRDYGARGPGAKPSPHRKDLGSDRWSCHENRYNHAE